MPTVDLDYAELEQIIGKKWTRKNLGTPDSPETFEHLDNYLAFVKGEVKGYNQCDGILTVEMKDTGRADLWSIEGLARGLRPYLGLEEGIRNYFVGEPAVEVNVEASLFSIRPYICCSVVRDIHLSDAIIRGIMHLQDKLDKTYGRNRQKTSIGIYNFDLIKPPIEYSAVKPTEFSFVPLGFTEEMNLDQILERHPKGIEYGHIVKKNQLYPLLFDRGDKILSFPPIINSNDLGKITEESRNLLIEVTGTLHKTVLDTLNLVTLALIDRGGKAFGAAIHYPEHSDYKEHAVTTPNFSNRCMTLTSKETNKLLGFELSSKKIADLLLRSGLGVQKVYDDSVEVLVPCYRVDVMHQVDLIEDVAVAYGYNNIEPIWRELATTGKPKPDQRLINIARELMVGSGYQEILTNTLTNPETIFSKMNQPKMPLVELANPKVVTMTCLRNSLLPNLIEFLSYNQSVEFPQKIFELGKVTQIDESKENRTRDEEWLSAATVHASANFTEIKSVLDAFFINLGIDWCITQSENPSFIAGRVGKVTIGGVDIGVIGEVNPAVLEAWKLENPVAAFEVNLQRILDDNSNSAK